jgi:hypothetical protein
LTTACAQLPKAELQAYTAAFEATRTTAEPILADYAAAERSGRLAAMKADRSRAYDGYFPGFRPSDVGALSEATLPPGAAAVDRTFHAIGRYNETLIALAENRNIAEARGQLNQMIDDLTAIAPGIEGLAPLKPAADFLVTLVTPAIVEDNRRQFTDIVLRAQPYVKGLIGELRNHTPTQYDFTIRALRARADDDMLPQAERDQAVEKINAWHRTYADYVALLNALERRVDELANAVRYPKSQAILQRAAAGVADLRNYTDALRLSLAALRAKP